MKKNEILENGWKRQEIWEGCVLASIAHAIFVAHNPEFSYEHSWDGYNYNTNDGQGSRGTVTFFQDFFIAGFRNEEFPLDTVNAKDYFIQAPQIVKEIAEQETLQYLLDDVNGKTIPVITTFLWEDENLVFSSHPYEEMMERGGNLLEIQSSDYESALESWEENYELTEKQLTLMKKLYTSKIANPTRNIILSKEDINAIEATDAEGINESKISFAEIGIEWPNK